MKKLMFAIFLATISCMFYLSAFAGDWEKNGNDWKYKTDDGTYLVNTWHQDYDYTWYYFGDDGNMWHDRWIDGKYYVGSSGGMLVNTVTPDGYWVGADGAWKTDEIGSASNGYNTVYKDAISQGPKKENCDYEFYYNHQVSSKNGTIYQIDGISRDKYDNPYIMYHLVSGNGKLTLNVACVFTDLTLKTEVNKQGTVTLRPNETSSELRTGYNYTKKCRVYIGNPYGRSSETANNSN